jgi:hypothetical protein
MAAPSYYDVKTGTIVLNPNACLYERFHELAHQEQHKTKLLIFQLWRLFRRIRGVGWILTLAIEIDAYRRAKTVMQCIGCWTDDDERYARRALLSYFAMKEVPDAHA